MGGILSFRLNSIPLIAAVSVSLLLPFAASPAYTQSPTPTTVLTAAHGSEFMGTVALNRQAAPDGALIEALVNDTVCGSATTQGGRYDIVVKSGRGTGNQFQQGCGENGNTIVFRSGSLTASQTGQFIGMTVQQLNLTFGQSATPTARGGLPTTGSAGDAAQGGSPLVPAGYSVAIGLTLMTLAAAVRLARRAWL
jgi:hypothetical protein